MRVVGVIPARWGSTRFPGKSLAPILGRPLIQWVIAGALKARRLDDVVVATDDNRIAAAVKSFGAKAVMTRSDHPSGTDRVAEAVRDTAADVVINIQGDEPLIDPDLVDRVADWMTGDETWDMATVACPIRTEAEVLARSVVKVVWDSRHRALYFSRSPIPMVRDGDVGLESRPYWRHIGLYGYRRAFLERLVKEPPCLLERCEKLEQLRALHIGGSIGVAEAEEAGVGVDTPADVRLVEPLLAARAKGGRA